MDHVRPQSKVRSVKRFALIGGLAVLLVGGAVTLANIDFSTERVDRSKLSIETVQRGLLEIKVSANGQLLPKHIEYIEAQVAGRVANSYVKAGDVVTAGQVLVELTNPESVDRAEEAYSAWQGAVTELKASESDLQTNLLNQQVVVTQSQFNLERAKLQMTAEGRLQGQHVIPEIDYERSKLNVAQLIRTSEIEANRLEKIRSNIKLQLAVKQSHVTELARALDRAHNQVTNLKVVAGIGGIVQSIGIDVGQQLQPGSPIGRIAQLDELYAELKVPAREAANVQRGQNVTVDTRSGLVNGTVSRVDPAVTDGTVIVAVDLKGPLPTGARPQLPIEGVIYLSQLPNTLYVGKPAFVKTDSVLSVYKLDTAGRYATRTTIQAGKLSVNYLQVLQGLRPGDRIITSDVGAWQDKERILIN